MGLLPLSTLRRVGQQNTNIEGNGIPAAYKTANAYTGMVPAPKRAGLPRTANQNTPQLTSSLSTPQSTSSTSDNVGLNSQNSTTGHLKIGKDSWDKIGPYIKGLYFAAWSGKDIGEAGRKALEPYLDNTFGDETRRTQNAWKDAGMWADYQRSQGFTPTDAEIQAYYNDALKNGYGSVSFGSGTQKYYGGAQPER